VQEVEESGAKLRAARRAKADRIGRALLEGDAVVLHPRWQVKNIARSGDDGVVCEAPAPPPRSLQQKHIVGIDMRADAAVWHRVAHHDVVESRLRNERETPQ
jgi:hypothetical protein